jgi:hypothetical protein
MRQTNINRIVEAFKVSMMLQELKVYGHGEAR